MKGVEVQKGTERNGGVGYVRIGSLLFTSNGAHALLVQLNLTPEGLVRRSLMVDTKPFPLTFSERLNIERATAGVQLLKSRRRKRRFRVGRHYFLLTTIVDDHG